MPKIVVLSLGGSLIVPGSYDTDFLRKFKKLIESYVKKGYKFAIICGGGKLARNIQEAASEISKISDEDLDWLGIYATRLNALLLRYIFGANTQDPIIANPNDKLVFKKNIIIASGWIPGWSTDYDAVLLAKNLGAREVINMSNVDYLYNKDPKKHSNAKKIEKISWIDFRKMVGTKWKAGLSVPFDPIAAKEAQESGIRVNIIGKDLGNLKNLLEGKKFKGTSIQ